MLTIAISLFVLAGALELMLFIAKDVLVRPAQGDALKAKILDAYKDVQQADERAKKRRDALNAAVDDLEKVRAQGHEIDEEAAKRKQVEPVFVHMIGQPTSTATRYRATLTKELPATPEPAQALIWGRPNFIDVWTFDVGSAHDAAVKQFETRLGYDVGPFTADGGKAGA